MNWYNWKKAHSLPQKASVIPSTRVLTTMQTDTLEDYNLLLLWKPFLTCKTIFNVKDSKWGLNTRFDRTYRVSSITWPRGKIHLESWKRSILPKHCGILLNNLENDRAADMAATVSWNQMIISFAEEFNHIFFLNLIHNNTIIKGFPNS